MGKQWHVNHVWSATLSPSESTLNMVLLRRCGPK